jgi:sugar diacid utilization regulator
MRIEYVRATFAERLRARSDEIERVAFERLRSTSDYDPSDPMGCEPQLKSSIAAAVSFGIEAMEREAGSPPPLPGLLLSDARSAARRGIRLQRLLAFYLSGHALLEDFLIEEAEHDGQATRGLLRALIHSQAQVFEKVVATVVAEYSREAQRSAYSAESRRVFLVEQILSGELIDIAHLAYEMDGSHLGVVAVGPQAAAVVTEVADAHGGRRLIVSHDEETVWAWLGSSRRTRPADLAHLHRRTNLAETAMAIGEPAAGIDGWRLTHRQARATLRLALLKPGRTTLYADVALLVAAGGDPLLVASLKKMYLAPLSEASDGGTALRETLRAYFATGGNVSSAAARLAVDRRTVSSRLRVAEEAIGRRLEACAADLTLALRLDELGGAGGHPTEG